MQAQVSKSKEHIIINWNEDNWLIYYKKTRILLLQNMIFSITDIHINLLVRKTRKTPAYLNISVSKTLNTTPQFVHIFHDFGAV